MADALRELRQDTIDKQPFNDPTVHYVTFQDVSEYLATFCRQMNPRFNRDRWLSYIAGECGPNGGRVK